MGKKLGISRLQPLPSFQGFLRSRKIVFSQANFTVPKNFRNPYFQKLLSGQAGISQTCSRETYASFVRRMWMVVTRTEASEKWQGLNHSDCEVCD